MVGLCQCAIFSVDVSFTDFFISGLSSFPLVPGSPLTERDARILRLFNLLFFVLTTRASEPLCYPLSALVARRIVLSCSSSGRVVIWTFAFSPGTPRADAGRGPGSATHYRLWWHVALFCLVLLRVVLSSGRLHFHLERRERMLVVGRGQHAWHHRAKSQMIRKRDSGKSLQRVR